MSMLNLKTTLDRIPGSLLPGTFITPGQTFAGVSTDTRTIRPDELFVAISGPNFDGHDYIPTAIERGATVIICRFWPAGLPAQPIAADGSPLIVLLTENPLAAYQTLASIFREKITVPVIAITGSVGKTSIRGMVAACLSTKYQVHQTKDNLNNEIGLPQTILATPDKAEVVVVEMGMRAADEVAVLSQIARPDIAIITNIGHSHIEFLGSQDAILRAKLEITEGLAPGGLLVLNADDPLLLTAGRDLIQKGTWRVAFVSTLATFSEPGAEFCLCAANIVTTSVGVRFTACLTHPGQTQTDLYCPDEDAIDRSEPCVMDEAGVYIPSPGMHQVTNGLFGLICAHALGLTLSEAAAGAVHFSNTGSRQRIIRIDTLTVMDDSYNASPESMQAAMLTLQTLAAPDHGRLIGVLGGMLELGAFTGPAHEMIGKAAAKSGFAELFLIGPQSEDVARGAHTVNPGLPVFHHENLDQLIASLIPAIHNRDFILIKGSRGFHMERVVAALEAAAAERCLIEQERAADV